MRGIAAIIVLMLAVAGCFTEGHGQACKAELKKAEDSVVVATTSDATVVNVASKSGIGGATLIRPGKAWPTNIMIRLKLNNLESFDVLVRRVEEWFEIVVPSEMIKENPEKIDCAWINEFRG